MSTYSIAGATVSVDHIGRDYSPEDRDYRQRYSYSIVTDAWRYDGDDIRSGCSAPVNVDSAAETLFSFLGACAESREYRERTGRGGENAELFPEHVGSWAEEHSDEIAMLACELSERYETESE